MRPRCPSAHRTNSGNAPFKGEVLLREKLVIPFKDTLKMPKGLTIPFKGNVPINTQVRVPLLHGPAVNVPINTAVPVETAPARGSPHSR